MEPISLTTFAMRMCMLLMNIFVLVLHAIVFQKKIIVKEVRQENIEPEFGEKKVPKKKIKVEPPRKEVSEKNKKVVARKKYVNPKLLKDKTYKYYC